MRFNESWITVRDMIDQLANIEGAVHSSTGRDRRRSDHNTIPSPEPSEPANTVQPAKTNAVNCVLA